MGRNVTSLPVTPREVIDNPFDEGLRQLTAAMPNARLTAWDNYNVATRVTARSKGSTYIVTDDRSSHSDQTITTRQGERMARLQEQHIGTLTMVIIDGFIGNAAEFKVPARLIIDKANANIAGMQKMLYFEVR